MLEAMKVVSQHALRNVRVLLCIYGDQLYWLLENVDELIWRGRQLPRLK